MVRRRTTSDTRTRVPGGSRTGRVSRTPRAMPDDTEMSARAARLRAGRQSAGAGGRQGLAGSAIYSIQDMLNHPAVGWSRSMARGPAQGKVDEITNSVHQSLAEQGIFQGEDGTWQIDLAKNAAYREAKRGSSSVPGIPQAGGGLPGGTLPRQPSTPNLPYPGPGTRTSTPAPTPTGGPGTRTTPAAKPPVSNVPGGPGATTVPVPPGGVPTTGTLPRQGPIYNPKPAPPVNNVPGAGGPVPSPGLGAGGLPVIPAPQPTGKPPAPTGSTNPGGMATPAAQGFSGGGYADPRVIEANRGTLPRQTTGLVDQGTQYPQQVVSGKYPHSWEDPNIRPIGYAEHPADYARYLRSMGYDERGNPLPKPPGPNPGGPPVNNVPGGPGATTVPVPPGGVPQRPGTLPRQGPAPAPRPGTPTPTGRPQAPTWPTMPNGQQMGQGSNPLGGQIQAQVQQMLAQRMGGVGQGAGAGAAGAAQGLAGLGQRIQQTVQNRIGPRIAGGAPTDGVGNPSLGGLANLGQQIQQSVQGRINGMPRPGMPNLPVPGGQLPTQPAGPAPGNPGGGAGMPPGPGTIPQPPGGPAPGNPSPAPPTGPGTGTGTLGSYGNASIDQWDSAFIAAGSAYGVDPRILKAMAEIESGGNGNIPLDQCRDDGYGDGGSCGLMQIKPAIWGPVSSTEEQIMQAAKILADYKAANPGATDKDALFAVYFPADDPNGTTQGSYSAKVDQLVAQMGEYTPGGGATTPIEPGGGQVPVPPGGVPLPNPSSIPMNTNVPIPNTANSNFPGSSPNQEPVAQMNQQTVGYLESLFPGAGQAAINNDYGFKSQGPNYYCNYVNWQCNMHTGLDIPASQNQEFNSLVSGQVVCYGGQRGSGFTDTTYNCGSYDTDDGTGVGNLTIKTQDGAYVTYGHTQLSYVNLEQQVQAGQPIGTAGYADGYHVHLEVRLPIGPNGEMLMVDPNLYFNGYYCNYGFCPR